LHPTKEVVISASLDGTARIASTSGGEATTVMTHQGGVTGCTLHATGDYLVTCSSDSSWALSSLEGKLMLRQSDESTGGYTCAGFHPDGLILATGTSKLVRVWDIKKPGSPATNFEGHTGTVTSLSFSENGYYLATGATDATVKIWDLRKLKNIHTITCTGSAAVGAVSFDFSGQYLAAAGSDVSVYETKGWSTIATFAPAGVPYTSAAFGASASFMVAGSANGVVKLFGSS